MVKRIVVIGAGGLGREAKSLIRAVGRTGGEWDFRGFVVSDLNALSDRDSRTEVLGDFEWLTRNKNEFEGIAVGIGNPTARIRVAQEIRKLLPDAIFPPLIHPTVLMDFESATVGEGVLMCAGVIGTVNVELEPFVLCNLSCTLGHEVRVGKGSVLNPGANISGAVEIGAGVLIGTGAQVLQYTKIGCGATVGAGAVVTRDVGPGVTVVGIPAKVLAK